jgi:AcrR family transcriptional regulator
MPRRRTVPDDAILRATAEAIGEHGPAALTLADVATRVGLSPATLLQRFGSKRGLLLKLAESGPASAKQNFTRAAARGPSSRRALTAALKAMTAGVASPQTMANNLAFLQLDLTDPEFHALAVAHARSFRSGIESLLVEAQRSGELDPETDTKRLAEAVETVYNGALITWAVHRRGKVENHLAKQLDTLLAPYSVERLHLGQDLGHGRLGVAEEQ